MFSPASNDAYLIRLGRRLPLYLASLAATIAVIVVLSIPAASPRGPHGVAVNHPVSSSGYRS
jgi:hypothetical protein